MDTKRKMQQNLDLRRNSACVYPDIICESTTNSVSAHGHPIVSKYLSDYSTTLADLFKQVSSCLFSYILMFHGLLTASAMVYIMIVSDQRAAFSGKDLVPESRVAIQRQGGLHKGIRGQKNHLACNEQRP